MSKRLAITIAGAVSLGSYEAGVLHEVLDAIHQHNSDPATLAAPGGKINIDVLTGASAGGMTAIILAQKLLFSADEFRGPYDNPLYNVWVKRIDLSGLQATKPDEPALHSLYSSDLIETISREMLLARYAVTPPPAPVQHGAASDAIRVGVAMTNLNGVDYGYPVEPSGSFVYRDYVDQRTRLVNSASDSAQFWEPLRQAAVACGAFPIAFRPQDILRSAIDEQEDYPAAHREPWASDPAMFTYADGGILQNQPLGMAKNLVDLFDKHNDQENRFYLFVSPHAKVAAAQNNFREANADYLHLAERLVTVVMGQSGFQDWITAKGVNERIARLDDRAKGLKDALKARTLPADALQTTATALLVLLFPDDSHTPPGANHPESLGAAKIRIAGQYKSEMDELALIGPEVALAFRDGILAFESAAGLGARDQMTIYGVTATEDELAGARLAAFLGFFDQTLRDHDYDVGRQHAQDVLSHPNLAKDGEIGPIRFVKRPIRPIDTRLNGMKLAALPVADLNEFKAGLKVRVNQMLGELLNGWEAALARGIVDPLLNAIVDRIIHSA